MESTAVLQTPRLKLTRRRKECLERILRTPTPCIEYDCFHQGTEIMNLLRRKVVVAPEDTLTPEQERTLFLQLNYYRCQREALRLKFLQQHSYSKENVLRLLHWDTRQHDIQSRLVSHNLGLVTYMARHCPYNDIDFEDLVSEGNIGLLRAIDRFDCLKGFRFSTYACRAILLSMSRYAKKQFQMWRRFPVSWEPSHETGDQIEEQRRERCQDQARLVIDIIKNDQAELSPVERFVLEMRFSLNNADGKVMTLKNIGQKLDLSKERIRQIQNQALAKVRQAIMAVLANEA
ncbi:MAG: sigma-70 family RNA polymerase sigma factor [Sedimentisphaerales bacterium]|nr:sigma-70 family RNA polymerase sigma factor [Sedimentisphaerales bacterium]